MSTLKPLSVILDEIEELADNATAGPWAAGGSSDYFPGWTEVVRAVDGRVAAAMTHLSEQLPNARFIASARTDVPALVKALRRAMPVIEQHGYLMRDITAILNQKQPDHGN